MIRVAVITVSDRCHRGEREDLGGPAVAAAAAELPATVVWTEIVPDEREEIAAAIVRSAAQANLVLTTGGTGIKRTFRHMEQLCGKTPLARLALTAKHLRKGDFMDQLKQFAADISR